MALKLESINNNFLESNNNLILAFDLIKSSSCWGHDTSHDTRYEWGQAQHVLHTKIMSLSKLFWHVIFARVIVDMLFVHEICDLFAKRSTCKTLHICNKKEIHKVLF